MSIGQKISHFPIVLNGSIKVITENEDGNELLLYYLELGDTCSMTLQCCMGHSVSKITAVAETATEIIMIPVSKMEEWVVKYPTWRQFTFNSFQERIDELLQSVDNLAFNDLENRLYAYLKDKAVVTSSEVLHITHQKIATELNTSRVVVSRLMKKLEKNGQLKMNRKSIHLTQLNSA